LVASQSTPTLNSANENDTIETNQQEKEEDNSIPSSHPSSSSSSSSSSSPSELILQDISDLTYYQLLSIPPSSSPNEIKRAYRRIALLTHPDRFSSFTDKTRAHSHFLRTSMAYEILMDRNKRMQYDEMVEIAGMKDYDEQAYRNWKRQREEEEYGYYRAHVYRAARGDFDTADTIGLTIGLIATIFMIIYPLVTMYEKTKSKKQKKQEFIKQLSKDTAKNLAKINSREEEEKERKRKEKLASEMRLANLEESDGEGEGDGEGENSNELNEEQKKKKEQRVQQKKIRVGFKLLCKPYLLEGEEVPVSMIEQWNRERQSNGSSIKNSSPSPTHRTQSSAVPLTSTSTANSDSNSSREIGNDNSSTMQIKFHPSDVDFLCTHLNSNELQQLMEKMTDLINNQQYTEAYQLFLSHLQQIHLALPPSLSSASLDTSRPPPPSSSSTSKSSSSSSSSSSSVSEWSSTEISALVKAMSRYPGGTPGRWEKITELIQSAAKGEKKRTVKEVTMKAREMEVFAPLQKTDNRAYEAYLETKKKQTPLSSSTSSSSVSTSAAPASLVSSLSTSSSPLPLSSVVSSNPATVSASVSGVVSATSKSSVVDWSAGQQSSLEDALRNVSKTAPDRWDQIAALVPGKSKAECVARFKWIKEQILAAQKQQTQ